MIRADHAATPPTATRRPRRARRLAFVVVAVAVTLGGGVGPGAVGPVPGIPVAAASAAPVAAAAEPDPGAQLPEPEHDPEEVRREADAILAGEEYRPPEKSIFTRILDWIAEKLGELLGGQPQPGGSGGRSIGAWVVLAVLVGLAALIAWRFARTTRRTSRQGDEEAFDIELTALRTPAGWAGEAERFEAAGEWKEALRARFRALLADLLDRGTIDDLPGRTTGEYRVLVRRRAPGAAAAFAGACDLFDRAWYGNLPTGSAENARLRALAADVLAALADEDAESAGPAPLEVPT